MLLSGRHNVIDHQGRSVPLVAAPTRPLMRSTPESQARNRIHRAFTTVKLAPRQRVILTLFIIPLVFLAALFPATIIFGLHVPLIPAVVLGSLAGFILPMSLGRLTRWLGRQQIADAIAAQGACASCAYDLRNVPHHPGGFRVCPECGAAWRLPDATSN